MVGSGLVMGWPRYVLLVVDFFVCSVCLRVSDCFACFVCFISLRFLTRLPPFDERPRPPKGPLPADTRSSQPAEVRQQLDGSKTELELGVQRLATKIDDVR